MRRVERSQEVATLCVGVDPSLSGHALAIFRDGVFQHAYGWTDKKTAQKKNPTSFSWLKLPSGRTEPNSQHRMDLLYRWTMGHALGYQAQTFHGVYVAIEGYAFSKRSRGLHEIHGLVECIKQGLWRRGVPFRIYDPLSIKMAWTGNGKADKEEMQTACLEHFGLEFDESNDPGGNLADATLIAALLQMELEIRAGRILLSDVPERIRKVMLRTTKSEPIAIISRDFVTPDASTVPDPIWAASSSYGER
jgi:Holliday junction resolvasome RuvABC endonuclease subunit